MTEGGRCNCRGQLLAWAVLSIFAPYPTSMEKKSAQGGNLSLNSADIVRDLARVEVLRDLPSRLLSTLARSCRIISAKRGSVVFIPGAPPGLYVVFGGRVAVLTRPSPSTEVEIARRHAGELFGEASLLLHKQINEARAVDRTLIARIDADAIQSVLQECPSAALAMGMLMAQRLADAEARLGEVTVRNIKSRLHTQLKRLAAADGVVDSSGDLIRDRLTHEELARMIGASRVAVSRALGQLQREDLVLFRGKRIVLRHVVVT